MKKLVEIMGGLEWVEIKNNEDILEVLKMDTRYIGTNYEFGIDIFEERTTGEFLGVKIRRGKNEK